MRTSRKVIKKYKKKTDPLFNCGFHLRDYSSVIQQKKLASNWVLYHQNDLPHTQDHIRSQVEQIRLIPPQLEGHECNFFM